MWNSANMAFCLCPMLTSGVIEALKLRGSDAQKKQFMEKLVSGESSGTMNLTEPQAGSDLSAVRTQAVPEGDHYKIKGTKIFITWGEHDMSKNIVHLVLARTPNAPEGVKGISLFIVPKFLVNEDGTRGARNDVKCVSIEHKMGIHGSPTCVLSYGETSGAIGYLVGEENRGLEYMFIMMNHARLGVGLEGVAIAERAYQHAREYARTRVQGRLVGQKSGDRVTIVHHPDVRRMLMTMKAQTEAMRALAYSASAALDKAAHHPDAAVRKTNQALVDFLIPVVKGWCTEQGVEIASLGVQIHGGMGFIEETGAAQHYRDAKILTIYEGTTAIQANDLIGRKTVRDGGRTAHAIASRIEVTEKELNAIGDASCARMAEQLSRARQSYLEAVDYLVGQGKAQPNALYAGSVNFLMLAGTLIAGWQMARAFVIIKGGAAQDETPAFLTAKAVTSQFYADHILPRTRAYRDCIVEGAESVMALEMEAF